MNEHYIISRDNKRLVHLSLQINCYEHSSGSAYNHLGTAVSDSDAIDWIGGKQIPFITVDLIGPQTINITAGYT